MDESVAEPMAELHISPKAVLIGLFVGSFALPVGAELLGYPQQRLDRVILCFIALAALAGLGWLLVDRNLVLGRWFTAAALVASVHLTGFWLQIPGALAWVTIPVAVAVPLGGLSIAIPVAAAESILTLASATWSASGVDRSEVASALIAIWAVLVGALALYWPLRQHVDWQDAFLDRARKALDEARDRRAELEVALENLASANRQLALASERMAALRTLAEDAQRAKTVFVSNVSHEFRTPLNMIIGLVEFMVDSPEIYDVVLSPKMVADLQVVQRNCKHLADMINDVLDLTRIEAGRMAIHRERVDLREIVQTSVEAVRPLLERKHLALDIALPPDLPQVDCDRTRIRQVILNLLSNAARFTEAGGISVRVDLQDRQVMVSVTDTGRGIAPQDVGRIFEPFRQDSGGLWRDKGGSGLGLAISKQFVELHGGRMWLESELGVGTSFHFTLPLTAPIEHLVRPGHLLRPDWVWRERAFRAGQSGATAGLAKPRVVVCDETGVLYSHFAHYVDEAEFVRANDLAGAQQNLQEYMGSTLVLNTDSLDDLCAEAEAATRLAPASPVIACCVPAPTPRAVEVGARGYLIKPISRSDVAALLAHLGDAVARVLVVDDDPEFRELLIRMLRAHRAQLDIWQASSGPEALAMLHRARPDLVLLDAVMPEMDGYQALEAMRRDGLVTDVPVYFVSAKDPTGQPPVSRALAVTVGGGLTLSQILRCSLEIPRLLVRPD